MAATFSRPLQKPGGGAFKPMTYSDIRKGYERLGGNPFGIKPDKAPTKCWVCHTTWYDNGITDGPGCNGGCCG